MQNLLSEGKKFWTFLHFLESLSSSQGIDFIKKKFNLSEDELYQCLYICHALGLSFKLQNGVLIPGKKEGRGFISQDVRLEFSIVEWLAMQAHFPLIEELAEDKGYSKILLEKFQEVEQNNSEEGRDNLFDLVGILNIHLKDENGRSVQNKSSKLLLALKKNIVEENCVKVQLKNQEESFELFPKRIILLEGKAILIGEDLRESFLRAIDIVNIVSIMKWEVSLNKKHISRSEDIHEFISGLKSLRNEGIRLVIKLKRPESFDASIAHELLVSPYITQNTQGEIIWAANTKITDHILSWLVDEIDNIEVLSPEDLRNKVESIFCQHNKIAS